MVWKRLLHEITKQLLGTEGLTYGSYFEGIWMDMIVGNFAYDLRFYRCCAFTPCPSARSPFWIP